MKVEEVIRRGLLTEEQVKNCEKMTRKEFEAMIQREKANNYKVLEVKDRLRKLYYGS